MPRLGLTTLLTALRHLQAPERHLMACRLAYPLDQSTEVAIWLLEIADRVVLSPPDRTTLGECRKAHSESRNPRWPVAARPVNIDGQPTGAADDEQ